MRSKAILVGAGASFVGPCVTLEEGEWVVDPHPSVEIKVWSSKKREFINSNGDGRLEGPARIYAVVKESYTGAGVYLNAVQVRRGQAKN